MMEGVSHAPQMDLVDIRGERLGKRLHEWMTQYIIG